MARPKNKGVLQRRGPQRQPFERVLIVCEGSKTESIYLQALCRDLQVPGVVAIGRGAGPSAVWKQAREAYARDRDFERVYCVFDRDTHEDYAAVLADIREQAGNGRIGKYKTRKTRLMAVPSDPCFEFWLLLHFELTTAAFGGPADVLARLRRCEGMADYRKSQRDLYERVRNHTDDAIHRAQQVRREAHANGSDTPVTDFDQLVEYLRAQRRQE